MAAGEARRHDSGLIIIFRVFNKNLMLKRLYIDNFRTLVNFEINFDEINLLLGGNGAGKSTVFEVLLAIKIFIGGYSNTIEGVLPSFKCTRWQNVPIQSFEMEIEGNGGKYKYKLEIEHNQENSYVRYEHLWFDNIPLLVFDRGNAQVCDDDLVVVKYPLFNLLQSFLLLIPSDHHTKLTWFKNYVAKFMIVKIVPSAMIGQSNQQSSQLGFYVENFVSWYYYISQDQGKIIEVTNGLREVLDGFVNFRFEKYSEKSVVLKAIFGSDMDRKKTIEYYFDELSDGQKVLIALYTILYYTQSEGYTLFIDEPENFLALPEIQPWLIKLYDLCSDRQLQAVLISHHPELINYLLVSPIGWWFERPSNLHTRVKRISHELTGLPISELISRGWLHEST
jgi:predicted ATPase